MASRLAKQEQVGFLYGDGERIFELYDFYFRTFIKDFDLFGNKLLLKILGVVSFFFTVDRSNKVLLETILKIFEIDYYEFNEAIDELEKRELVEVQYNHVRVSEQVMATYFFYKVFIKDEILSFRTLLFTYFPLWKRRFSDTIIPSNNSFGYNSVFKKISITLDDYLYSVYSDEEKVLGFFSLFWFYKREENLAYFHQKIKKIPESENLIYETNYNTNDFVWDRDRTLDFLSNLFNHYTESFIPSLELAFEYCRKKPESLPELIRRIREKLLFDDDDYQHNFVRQVELFKLLITKFKEKQPHYVQAFFALAGTFLSHHFQITKGGRNHSITFYQYPLPFYEVTREFRESIWNTLFGYYEEYSKEIFLIISHFRPGFREAISEILEFDLSLLVPFIENKLDPFSFENIHFVNDLVGWLNREKLLDRNYQNLKVKFASKEYEYFKKIDWNTFREMQDYEFDNYDDFQKQKEQDIRASFVFHSEADFAALHTAIKNTLSLESNNGFGIDQSLNIVVEENFLQNEALGFKLLESIFDNYPKGLNPLSKAIRVIVHKSSIWALRLWKLIHNWNHEYKLYWELAFFDCLPVELANNFYKNELLATIKSIDKGCYLHFESYEKFFPVKSDKLGDRTQRFLSTISFINKFINYKEKNIIEEILFIVCQKIETGGLRITLSFHFFEKYSVMLAHNFELLKKAYIQQIRDINQHFDLQNAGLKTLLQIKPTFLFEYIRTFYTDEKNNHNRNTHNQLPFVWDLEQCNELVEEAVNIIIENNTYYGILEYPLIIFFHHLNEAQKTKAKTFLLNYITKYNLDEDKMNSVFDVLRHTMKEFFEEAFLHYLNQNTDIENFKKIWWRGNGGTYTGDVIIGEIQAKEWQNILAIAEKSKDQLDLIPIKNYIKRQIENELRSGEEERKRKFINPDGW